MSFIIPSRALALSRIVVRKSRCCSLSELSSKRSVIPIMAFIGVRISWLVLARNSDLNLADSSASSLAFASSSSASFSEVMSFETPTRPMIAPPGDLIGILVVKTHPSLPSFQVSFSVLPIIARPDLRMLFSSIKANLACSALKKSASVFPTASSGLSNPKSCASARLIIRN